MLLALDIGNSSISVGIFDISSCTSSSINESNLIHSFKISAKGLSADEYALLIYNFLILKNIYPSDKSEYFSSSTENQNKLEYAVIASVVPAMTDVLAKSAEYLIGKPPFIIAAGIKTGFGIRIKNPEQLGADIVANTAFAIDTASLPLIILDVGTATTLTVVDSNKYILGTIITPGIRISLEALSGSAALLSDISLTAKSDSNKQCMDNLIGRDTAESVRSGVVNGHIIMIDGFVRNIRDYFSNKGESGKVSLISTGGLSHIVTPYLRNKFTNYDTLTLFGIAKLFLMNHSNLS